MNLLTLRCCLVNFFILIAVTQCIAIPVIATQKYKAELTIQGILVTQIEALV